jgi:SAM-dependent methyltransferase
MRAVETHYWEAVGGEWSRRYPDALWRRHCDAVNLHLLSRWLPAHPAPRLLKTDLFDEAVTDGLYPLLRARARVVVGMDLSSVTAGAARSRFPEIKTTCADARKLPFAAETFDVIVSASTLDHFHTQDELIAGLRELHRVLRPDGVLLLTMDNLANPFVALRNRLPFWLLRRLGVVPYYVGVSGGPGRLRRLLERTGWSIHEMDAVLHCPRALAVPVARWVQRNGKPECQERLLRGLMKHEWLARRATRFLTGHFVAARLMRKSPT